ncbi:hypothetical protein [Ferrovibrio sp.]|uniref:hypothetical protein n=1 Tax=Ferrovibrio sp. TaxID=1917215 RepID=UPI003D298033
MNEPHNSAILLTITSRFARLAKREGGKSAAEALQAAESFIEDKQEKYFGWVTADLERLNKLLSLLDADPASDKASEAAYRKAVHIRDLGSSFGHAIITEVADSLCELLYRFRMNRIYNPEAVAAHRSALKLVCTMQFSTLPADAGLTLQDGLRKVVAKYPKVED